mgnify:FL=1
MTKSDVMKEFLKKTVIPVVVALFLFSMFSRIFIENGVPDYFLIWLACGVPFGIGKMFTLIPIGFGISGTVGVVALNLVLGGLIGGVILIWKLAVALWYQELAEQYAVPNLGMCPFHQKGQVLYSDGINPPEGMCGVAWQVIGPMVRRLSEGQTVQPTGTWLNEDSICVFACPDGIRPVIFLLEAQDNSIPL